MVVRLLGQGGLSKNNTPAVYFNTFYLDIDAHLGVGTPFLFS